jgi:hypothetical protein
MAQEDYYDHQDEGSQDNSDMDMENDSTPEEKMGLVPLSFFNKDVKPGDKETVEVTAIKDGEAVIKCVYGEGKDKGGTSDEGMSDTSAPSEAEDSMMT